MTPVSRFGAHAPLLFARSARLRAWSRVVLAAWLCPILLSWFVVGSVAPAKAQPLQGPLETTVVLDFSVPRGIDAVVGRKAADALAVELQRSGSFDVKTRQEVETATTNQPGLSPPFNTSTQSNLARAVSARSVFSGRVTSVQTQPGRQARVQIEVRQLEAATEDYINGTLIQETSSIALTERPTEVLVDEAINKAAVAAVRSLGQTQLPRGSVLNVTSRDVELGIGAQNGVFVGQRYSVLRDVLNRATGRVERVKVGEVRITRVESNQSTAVLSAGGQGGVTTNDRVRRIYDLSNLSVSSGSRSGDESVTPVNAAPQRQGGNRGIRRAGRGLLGILGLAVGVAVLGLGGGGDDGTDAPESVSAYRNIPRNPQNGYINNQNGYFGDILVQFDSGASGFETDPRNIGGYFIYRAQVGQSGNTSGLSGDDDDLQGFVSGNQLFFRDNLGGALGREVTVTSTGTDVNVTRNNAGTNEPTIMFSATNTAITADFIQQFPFSGRSYIYGVRRVTLITNNTTTGTPNAGVLELSNLSRASGRVTAFAGPDVTATNGNLSAFEVTFAARTNAVEFPGTAPTATPNPTPVVTVAPNSQAIYLNATEFAVQVSSNPRFPSNDRFFTTVAKPANADNVDAITLSLGDINQSQIAGRDPLNVRVGVRNTNDGPGDDTPFVFGNPFQFSPGVATQGVAFARNSRLLRAPDPTRDVEALGLPGLSNNRLSVRRSASGARIVRRPGRILRR